MSSSDRVQEYHPDRLGEYVLLSDKAKVRLTNLFLPCVKIVFAFFCLSCFLPHLLAPSFPPLFLSRPPLFPLYQEGYLGPVYAKIGDGPPSYLYSHHPKGKVPPARVLTPSCQVWTIGSSETSWSLRLNKLSDEEEFTCPLDTLLDK